MGHCLTFGAFVQQGRRKPVTKLNYFSKRKTTKLYYRFPHTQSKMGNRITGTRSKMGRCRTSWEVFKGNLTRSKMGVCPTNRKKCFSFWPGSKMGVCDTNSDKAPKNEKQKIVKLPRQGKYKSGYTPPVGRPPRPPPPLGGVPSPVPTTTKEERATLPSYPLACAKSRHIFKALSLRSWFF